MNNIISLDSDDENETKISSPKRIKISSITIPTSDLGPNITSVASSSQSVALRPDGLPKWLDGIDTTNKPIKYIKRMMGETKKLFSPDGMKTQQMEGFVFSLLGNARGHDLSKWEVLLCTEGINKDSQLAKDLIRHKLKGVLLEMTIPDQFPMKPPFVRVRHPKLIGGYVFEHGAICFEPLTPKGWPIAMTLLSLSVAIKGIFDYNPVSIDKVGDVENQTIPGYTEEGALRDYNVVVAAHQGGKTWHDLSHMKS
eukprot:GEMP01034578.1.p1 GENE.GEMP01034578.1~~GEMP01034578.1.p1  ORF type:complete len:254 (+),score=50.92 GEMP01034578.1:25-786(+)